MSSRITTSQFSIKQALSTQARDRPLLGSVVLVGSARWAAAWAAIAADIELRAL